MTPTVHSTTTPRLSSSRHREILRRCAEDDAFRAELQRDAVAALARYGVALDAGFVPAAVTLPEKSELRRALGDESGMDIPWMGLVTKSPAVATGEAVRRG